MTHCTSNVANGTKIPKIASTRRAVFDGVPSDNGPSQQLIMTF